MTDSTAAGMTAGIAKAHRRIGEEEHAVEERLKKVAQRLPDSDRFAEAAEELSRRADVHLAKADDLEERATE